MLFEALIETYIKFYLLLVSTVGCGMYNGSKMVYSLLSCNLISGWGEEAVLCER